MKLTYPQIKAMYYMRGNMTFSTGKASVNVLIKSGISLTTLNKLEEIGLVHVYSITSASPSVEFTHKGQRVLSVFLSAMQQAGFSFLSTSDQKLVTSTVNRAVKDL